MNIISRLLRKNTSPARIAGFILSNFIGLAIVAAGLQFYLDARSLWESEDSFIKTDYLVVNKRVTSANTLGAEGSRSSFTQAETEEIVRQPWVRSVGKFTAADYKVYASLNQGDRGMSTYMFFESLPDEYVDVKSSAWSWKGGEEVPLIISKDYLTLYNFGFASSAGMPQMSESIMSGIPLGLRLRSEDGNRTEEYVGRVVGYSNRLNTILVPQSFMDATNATLGSGRDRKPSRLIIDVSSPGDVAIAPYLESHDMEVAGDKSGSSASYLLKVVTGIVVGVGSVITLLSFFILLLSISLLMEKNRDKLHSLLMLGYPLRTVAAPYCRLVVWASLGAMILAVVSTLLLRGYYLPPLEGMGASGGGLVWSLLATVVITLAVILFNILSVRRKVRAAWRL
ncbi:MAG: ABC transporter permease [Muribaculaceae bacterium]|nr:ABC transporter permease [Muribaculaceae bacterium]